MLDSLNTRNHLRMALIAIAMLLGMLAQASRPASADTTCAGGNCVLACDTRLRQCSMYSLQEITPRLTIVEFMPYGYRRVYSTSACERRVCTRRNASCFDYP